METVFPRIPSQALSWLRKSADNGYAVAQQALGFLYFLRRGWAFRGCGPVRILV